MRKQVIYEKSLGNGKNTSYTKFIILGLPRTGTNLLQTLLDSHSAIISLGEIFNPLSPLEKTGCNYDHFSHRKGSSKADEVRARDPVRFIEKYIFKQYTPDITAVGFKVSNADWRVWKFLNMLDTLKVIRLKRDNYLQMLVSFMFAMKSGAWTSKCSQKIHKNRCKSITLEHRDCLNYFNHWDRWDKLTRKIFFGHAELEVFYKDLTDCRETTTRSVLKFLGVHCCRLISDLEKQTLEPLSKLVQNYVDLKASFSGTKWSKFFIE